MVSRLALKMKQKEINITITIVDVDKSLSTDSGSFVVEDLDILKYTEEYNKTYNDSYKWLISKRHISTYDSQTYEIEKQTMIRPICCTFKFDESEMVALDLNKAYTSNLMDMKKFPVFNSLINIKNMMIIKLKVILCIMSKLIGRMMSQLFYLVLYIQGHMGIN